jgi:hypothetical protein
VSDRTADCAAGSAHGWAAEQAVPVPDGEAKKVVVAAKAGGDDATSATAETSSAAETVPSTSLRLASDDDLSTETPDSS